MMSCQHSASTPREEELRPFHQKRADEWADDGAASADRGPDHRLRSRTPGRHRGTKSTPTQAAYIAPAAAAMKAETQKTKMR